MTRFWEEFSKVYIKIDLPDGGRLTIREVLSPLDREWLLFVPPAPPEFDHPQAHSELILWQERLRKSNEAADMLGQKIARALREGFQKRIWQNANPVA